MRRFYNPGDPHSSPYDPYMGAIVVYRQAGSRSRESYPAIIVRVYDDDRADLTVFSTTGVRYLHGVPFHADDSQGHSWGWLPEPVRRPLQAPAEKTTEVA